MNTALTIYALVLLVPAAAVVLLLAGAAIQEAPRSPVGHVTAALGVALMVCTVALAWGGAA